MTQRPRKAINVHIDLETLCLDQPDAGVWQIGAVVGEVQLNIRDLDVTINPATVETIGFSVCENTVKWQEQNNRENWETAKRIPLGTTTPSILASNFVNWLTSVQEVATTMEVGIRIWFRGNKDENWLKNLLKQTGYSIPWEYWQVADQRTASLFTDYDRATDHVSHCAVEDARKQAQTIHSLLLQFGLSIN